MPNTIKLRRKGANCVIPYLPDEVKDGDVVEVPRGVGFEIDDGKGGLMPDKGWEYVEELAAKKPAKAGGK